MKIFPLQDKKIVFVTAPEKEAYQISEKMIKEKLAACANIIRKIDSIYWWQGKIEKGCESLILFKTSGKKVKKLLQRVKKVHSYKVPEIITVDISSGDKEYLNWINESIN